MPSDDPPPDPSPEPPRPAAAEMQIRRVLVGLRRMAQGRILYSRRLVRSFGLTEPQLVCLNALVEHGPLSPSRLGAVVFLSPSTVVGIVDRLERAGLVTRCRATHDRRVVLLHATESACDVASRAPSPLQDRLTEGLRDLPDDDRERLVAAVEQLVDMMDVRHVAPEPASALAAPLHVPSEPPIGPRDPPDRRIA